MVSVGDEKQAKANLRFLAESQLIDDALAAHVLAAKEAPVLPSPAAIGPTSARDFQAVRSDDDALDLVLSWERGFVSNANPDLSTNSGITVTELSQYLKRQASIEELKALTPATIKDYYKSYLGPAAGIESQLVRARFPEQRRDERAGNRNPDLPGGRGEGQRDQDSPGRDIWPTEHRCY
jgi:hypothetical protein